MPLSHLKSGLKQQKCGFNPANDCPHPFPAFDKSAHDAELLLMWREAAALLNPARPFHDSLLRSLWSAGNLGGPDDFDVKSPMWIVLGFSEPDPLADMPSVLQARNLLHFLRTSDPRRLAKIHCQNEIGDETFPLAMVSVQVTQCLASYLRMQPSFAAQACSDRVLFEFTRLTRAHRQKGLPPPLDLMHCTLLQLVLDQWQSAQRGILLVTDPRDPLAAVASRLPRALESLEGPWECCAMLDAIRATGRVPGGLRATGERVLAGARLAKLFHNAHTDHNSTQRVATTQRLAAYAPLLKVSTAAAAA